MGPWLVADGLGLRGTSRVLEIKLDTVRRWLAVAALHRQQVNDLLLRDPKLRHVQVDELWAFVKKTTRIPLDRQPPSHISSPKKGGAVAWERPGSGEPLFLSFVSIRPSWWGFAILTVPVDSSGRFKDTWIIRSRSLLLTASGIMPKSFWNALAYGKSHPPQDSWDASRNLPGPLT